MECLEPKQAAVVQCDAVHGRSRVVERRAKDMGGVAGAAGSNDGSGRRQRDVVKT